jgi:phenylacetate-coenzyme A ligase PaaK-like adenylate-forming protein
MRCWDGGATFFTCKYNTYHLLDNLSWCDEYENKLISTDYFSFPSPFVNYWNGDYCEIKSNYKRCECGRLYRPFKFLQSRPFAIKGYIVHDIYNNLIKLEINSIKQIKCDYNNIIIISNKEIELEKKNIMKKQFEKINFKFIVE